MLRLKEQWIILKISEAIDMKILVILILIVTAYAPIDSYKRMRQAQKERLKYDKIIIDGKAYHPESVYGYPEIRFEIILMIYLILFALLGTSLLVDFN